MLNSSSFPVGIYRKGEFDLKLLLAFFDGLIWGRTKGGMHPPNTIVVAAIAAICLLSEQRQRLRE